MNENIIGMLAASTNLDPTDIKYEIDMINFSSELFNALNKTSIKAYLFGGTALNKGFFKDKQRLSRDFDFEIENPRDFKKTAINFESCIIKAGYPNIRINESKRSHTIYVALAESESELKIDLVPQLNAVKPIRLTLHSILDYSGVPTKTVETLSYPFEYLLAYKLNALRRRMLYKDIYDSYTALQMPLDKKKLIHYVTMFMKPRSMFEEISYNIENDEYDKKDELAYGKLVQEKYKVPMKNMLYEIRSRLSQYYGQK
jgi:predicted nucleotidyltransferase component of viral defense system